ncbi:MAG: hypothetical protein SV062_03110 [Thermodesulfobacteriota bacterium]|nr:hypothetical protein [Thermodesulfobacteriota bacterium]
MAKKFDQKEKVSIEELLTYEIITTEALINLLDRKGLVSKKEVLEEIRVLKSELEEGK